MLSKYYNKMINDSSEQLNVFKQILDYFLSNRINDVDTIIKIQEKAIFLGEFLETQFDLNNTLIIHRLERICELLYSITINPDIKFLEELQLLSDNLIDDLKDSKQVSEIKLSLVLVIKNEASYVKEWLEFHNMLGVERFYIYDNGSDDNLIDILKPYMDNGLVLYHYWPGKLAQLSSYNHAISHYKYDSEYMGFIDTDEFLFPIEGFSLPNTIDKIFFDYEHHIAHIIKAGGIGVNWRTYGTSHLKTRPHGLQIENYTLRGFDDYPQNIHIKTIVKPTLAKGFVNNPHNLVYKDSYFTISEHGSMIPSAFFYDGHCDILRINHYYTRSEEELYFKMKIRGWPDVSDDVQKQYAKRFDNRLIECNDIEDHIMERFIVPLRNRIK